MVAGRETNCGVDVAKSMDATLEAAQAELNEKWELMAFKKTDVDGKKLVEMIDKEDYDAARRGPMVRKDYGPVSPTTFS